MHEMSIAQSIVELAEEQARSRHSEAVEELELEIGRLAGVELHTLDFAVYPVQELLPYPHRDGDDDVHGHVHDDGRVRDDDGVLHTRKFHT